MNKILRWILALAAWVLIMASSPASAQTASSVVISGLETGTAVSGSQEYIELYNPTDTDISVTGWSVEYKSATSSDTPSNWVRHASLTGTVVAHGFYLVAPKAYLSVADADWSATLAGSAGNIRVRDANGVVVDQLGYGSTANAAEGGAPAPAPPAGQAVVRLPGRLSPGTGNGIDTNNNAADFILDPLPNPRSTLSLTESPDDTDDAGSILVSDPPEVVSPPTDPSPVVVDDSPVAQDYAPLDITEALVNPMTPLTDDHDEFVELYNPTSDPVNLAGYTIRAGSKFHSYYVLPSSTLASGAYVAFYSSQTGVSLPNTGGAIEVLDPSGQVVDVTPVYGEAPEGQSWARFDDGWHWTLQTTPGQPNVLASVVTLTSTTAKTAKPKKTKTPTAKATKPKKAKKVYVPHPRKKKPKATLAKAEPLGSTPLPLRPATWLLIGLGVLTIGYAIYEFRYDIQNLYQRFGRHSEAGPTDRSSDQGRLPD